jgi:hypothetical protein
MRHQPTSLKELRERTDASVDKYSQLLLTMVLTQIGDAPDVSEACRRVRAMFAEFKR